MSDNIKRRKTFELRLTKFEVLHLRDIFSVAFPPDGSKTVSKALAELENRTIVENVLWKKIVDLCSMAGVPLEDEAPDYIIAPTSPPPMGVFMLASEPDVHDPTQPVEDQEDGDVQE
jgi:hypothetical protein